MLPASARVRSRSEHRLVAAKGLRARRGPLVVHLYAAAPGSGPARAGVIVGKRVGPAVCRNLVKRRLREQLRSRLPVLPDGALLVVRAMPGSGEAGFGRLGAALDAALSALGALPSRGEAGQVTEVRRPGGHTVTRRVAASGSRADGSAPGADTGQRHADTIGRGAR